MGLNRRDFLTGISVVGVPAILLPGVVLDAVEGSEDPSLPLAAKARKLVDYVVTQKDHPRVRDYSWHPDDPRDALVEMNAGGLAYVVSTRPVAGLHIDLHPIEDRYGQASSLIDYNLDGMIENGMVTRDVSALLPSEIQQLNRFPHGITIMGFLSGSAGLEIPERAIELFQKLYEHTLDTLIGVYEKQP